MENCTVYTRLVRVAKEYDEKFEENSKDCEAKKVLRRGIKSINI